MRTRSLILVLNLIPIIASAQPHPKPSTTLDEFVRHALSQGKDTYVPRIICSLIDLPSDVHSKLIKMTKDQTVDNMTHLLEVAVEKSSSSEHFIPIALAWSTDYNWPANNETYYFRTTVEGALIKAVAIHGKRDGQGKPIRGAGTVTVKDIHSPEIQERFQHEMDFWLKGAYQKKN